MKTLPFYKAYISVNLLSVRKALEKRSIQSSMSSEGPSLFDKELFVVKFIQLIQHRSSVDAFETMSSNFLPSSSKTRMSYIDDSISLIKIFVQDVNRTAQSLESDDRESLEKLQHYVNECQSFGVCITYVNKSIVIVREWFLESKRRKHQ
jgi:hypothetical protein